MGVDRVSPSPSPSSSTTASDNQQHVPSEEELTSLFDAAMKRAAEHPAGVNGSITRDEQQRFLKAMGDPEFRALLNDYMTEIADPAHRAETEQYLAQLEAEQRVPENKLLIRPTPGLRRQDLVDQRRRCCQAQDLCQHLQQPRAPATVVDARRRDRQVPGRTLVAAAVLAGSRARREGQKRRLGPRVRRVFPPDDRANGAAPARVP
ncbi:hypothetical protein PINS_up010637 [Pythium insidiosum]|nr:hypothetical protein PINS_up010637 [Pythium insidiosum]